MNDSSEISGFQKYIMLPIVLLSVGYFFYTAFVSGPDKCKKLCQKKGYSYEAFLKSRVGHATESNKCRCLDADNKIKEFIL